MNLEEAYKILGINKRNYNQEELKVYYRKMVLNHHPDRGGNEQKFKKIIEAYNFLKNYTPSKSYSSAKQNTKTKPKRNVFDEKRQKRRTKPADPQDVIIPIEVSVEELHKGFEQNVKYRRRKACDNCYGSGCYICDGQLHHQSLEVGIYIHSTLMNDDNEIIYKGFGEITYEAADLVIKLNIVKSKFSLTTEENIKFPIVTSTASVSKNQTHVLVNTLDSTVKVAIPEDHKDVLRLKGKGLKFDTSKGTIRGDHHVILKYN